MGAGLPSDIRRAQSGQVPCSGARRRGEALDEVSAAIPGDAVAGNGKHERRRPMGLPRKRHPSASAVRLDALVGLLILVLTDGHANRKDAFSDVPQPIF